MTGEGRAWGAASIVNAFATGHGAALALQFHVRARARPARSWSVWNGRRRLGAAAGRLVLETARHVQDTLATPEPMRVDVQSDIPPKKGLKSSSAVGVAVARAVLDHVGATLAPRHLLSLVGDAALASGTSLTGAFDDAAACLLGGIAFTDNDARRLVAHDQLPGTLVALVHVPRQSIATGTLRRKDFKDLAALAEAAWEFGRAGRYKEAMLTNTLAYAPRLGVHPEFTFRALRLGAYAAGLSGKGPAEVALIHRDELEHYASLRAASRVVNLTSEPAP